MVCYRAPIKVEWKNVMVGKRLFLGAVMGLSLLATPAFGQSQSNYGSDADNFVRAVRERDGDKAMNLLRDRPTVLNARDLKGDTGLIAAITLREPNWTGYLLKEGADPNFAARDGETPLIAAARVGFEDATQWLVDMGAKVDAANKMGETALIVAVQQRQIPIIRILLTKGADPDKTDSAQGYSARDYAKRDNRGGEILRLIEAVKPKPATAATSR
jgi:ankyrin repeat protein